MGIKERWSVKLHLHLSTGAAKRCLGGIGCVLGDEEIEYVDGLGGFGRHCWRRSGCLWQWVNDGDGIICIRVRRIFDEGFLGDEGGGCGDVDGFFGFFGRFRFVEASLVLLRFRYTGLDASEP